LVSIHNTITSFLTSGQAGIDEPLLTTERRAGKVSQVCLPKVPSGLPSTISNQNVTRSL
jgi:hypothetical protein